MENIGYRKDAEGAGKWCKDHIWPKSNRTLMDVETIRWVAVWAGHWGRLELKRNENQDDHDRTV